MSVEKSTEPWQNRSNRSREPTQTGYRRPVRRAANIAGRVLVTLGTLLLLFVAYQLWGTGFYEARQQSELKSQFRAAQRSAEATRAPVTGTTTTTTPPAPPPTGDAIAIIRIPKIGLDRAVVQGVGVPDLRKGPGHYPDSPMPGQIGNAAIAGHRTTYGAPFNRIDELAAGDEVSIQTVSGTFRYLVTGQIVVDPHDTEVLDATPDATLTLTTCNPKYSARQRLIVKAQLDVPKSPPPAPPTVVTDAQDVGDLAGATQSRVPVLWWALIVAAVGALWWWVFRRWRRWYVWVAGVLPFLAVYAVFCFYFERVLPPGY